MIFSSSNEIDLFSDQIEKLNKDIVVIHNIYLYEGVEIDYVVITDNSVLLFKKKHLYDTDEMIVYLDDLYTSVELIMKKEKMFLSGRNLIFKFNVLAFDDSSDENHFTSEKKALQCIRDNKSVSTIDSETQKLLIGIFQNLSNLNTKTKVTHGDASLLSYKFETLINQTINLDLEQTYAASHYQGGPLRIRGLAGSGKTIVLAQLIAKIHAKNPQKKILCTVYSKSLIKTIKEFIEKFFSSNFANREIDWKKILVIHSWGSINEQGVYYLYSKHCGSHYYSFGEAKEKKKSDEEPFTFATRKALEYKDEKLGLYDYVFMDEAQDYPSSFFKICLNLCTNKSIVWASDELQTINDLVTSNLSQMFDDEITEDELLSSKCDIILKHCYRNLSINLKMAHCFGFGIYRKEGMIQGFENPNFYNTLGYTTVEGSLKNEDNVTLDRYDILDNKQIEHIESIEKFLNVEKFESYDKQLDFVIAKIQFFLDQNFNLSNMLVIFPDGLNLYQKSDYLKSKLTKAQIDYAIVGEGTGGEKVFKDGVLALSHIYRAKGNEANIVFLLDAQECNPKHLNITTRRNILFTAMTRSKGWVYVLGNDTRTHSFSELVEEYNLYITNKSMLKFCLPSLTELNKIRSNYKSIGTNEEKIARDALSTPASLQVILNKCWVDYQKDPDSVSPDIKLLFESIKDVK